MSAASSSSTPNCPSTNATASARLAAPRSTTAKIILANEATTLCHGAEAAAAAEATARAVFAEGGVGADLPRLALAPGEVPETGISIVQLLVRSGLAASGKEAKRLIAEGGARLDDTAITDAGLLLTASRPRRRPQALRRPQAPRPGRPLRLTKGNRIRPRITGT